MWSYYGRKSKLVNYYPKAKHGKIIEPFAGTAPYSLLDGHWQKEIVLLDKYEVIVRIWKYLQQAKEKDILSLPDLKKGDKIDSFTQLCDEEKWLIGFCVNRGNPRPVKTANNYNSWNKDKVRIAENLYKIRHWTILHGDYSDLENEEATWFIDPPYQNKGYKYKYNSKKINYEHLAEWCRSRKGQVIVCENIGAEWLNFQPLLDFRGINGKNTEAIWYKEYDFENKDKGIDFLSWELAKKEMEILELRKRLAN